MAKAGRPRKGSRGLPTWFNYSKYKQVAGFKAKDWGHQLALRFVFFEQLSKEDPNPEICAMWLELVKSAPDYTLTSVFEAMLAHSPAKSTRGLYESPRSPGRDLFNKLIALGEPLHGIRVLSNKDIAFTSEDFQEELHERDHDEDLEDWGAQPFLGAAASASPHKRHLEVDLRLGNELLVKQFVEHLHEQRTVLQKSEIPFLKTQSFANWHACGVLPYIDLNLWALASGETYRWSAFENAVRTINNWQQDDTYTDTCRKTVKSLSDRLLSEGTLQILNHQALQEMREGSKQSGNLFVR